MIKRIKSYISCRAAPLLAAMFLTGCIKESPNEIAERLMPEIAADLISKQDSSRIYGLPPKVQELLGMHAAEGITFQLWAPELHGEAGIRFYSKKDHRRFLSIALDLHESEKAYIFAGFSEADGD